jgi:hypothetical protein
MLRKYITHNLDTQPHSNCLILQSVMLALRNRKQNSNYEGHFLSKNRLRISPAQVNTPRRFKVARPQSSVGFVPSTFSTDCII